MKSRRRGKVFSSASEKVDRPRVLSGPILSNMRLCRLIKIEVAAATTARSILFGLVLLAFFLVLLALVVAAHDFTIGSKFDARLFSVLFNDRFVVLAFFFPADNRSAGGLSICSRLHRGRDIRLTDGFLLVFLSVCLSNSAECQTGAHRHCRN